MDNTLQRLLNKKGQEVYSIQANQTVYEAIAEMDQRNVGGLIVKDDEKIVGIITERDYMRKVILKGRSSKETPVEAIMSRDLVSVTPEHKIQQAMELMTEKRCRHLPVFKDEQLVGMLSIGDLVKAIIADQELQIQILKDYVSGR
ncbi:MAG: CBS domain-containing protein [Planctomycetes bacterium]|nr:CBS domain-containing protein [Planctomycetota bacterium]